MLHLEKNRKNIPLKIKCSFFSDMQKFSNELVFKNLNESIFEAE